MPVSPQWRRRLLAVIFAFGISIGIGECAVPLSDPLLSELDRRAGWSVLGGQLPLAYSQAGIEALAEARTYLMFDRDLGWVTTPGIELTRNELRYRNNNQGLRAERDYSLLPAAGIDRIAAYGDSFTYCAEVDVQNCWTGLLEQHLPHAEVLNFGVVGYGPDQAWLRYQRDGAGWYPCAVLIGHMVENINRVVNRFRPFLVNTNELPAAKPRFVVDGDQLVLMPSPVERPEDLKDPAWVEANLGPYDTWYFPGLFVGNPLDRSRLVRLVRTAVYQKATRDARFWSSDWAARVYRDRGEAFTVLTRVLAGFADEVSGKGATPVVVIFPSPGEIAGQAEGRSKPHAPLLETLRQRGIRYIDLTDALGAEARASGLDEVVGIHLSPLGNAVVARTLADQLPSLVAETCANVRRPLSAHVEWPSTPGR